MPSPNTFQRSATTESDVPPALIGPEIDAPPHFVSVYHETKSEYLEAIAEKGLTPNTEQKNIGQEVTRMNERLDLYRPDNLVSLGISRAHGLFAYPFLDKGHGLFGADRRFIPKKLKYLQADFELFEQHDPDYLRKLGALTLESYIQKQTDPGYLKQRYPGEVLELKIDPDRAIVLDLEKFTQIVMDQRNGWLDDDDMPDAAADYWKQAITLREFIRWYAIAEDSEDGNSVKNADMFASGNAAWPGRSSLFKGAPSHLPDSLWQPEILIAGSVPVKHMRLVA